MKPPAPAGNPHRRGMPPPLLRRSSRNAIRNALPAAAADGDHEAAVSEHPCVTLVEWWLATVGGDDPKIAVAGIFERNQTLHEYSPAPIAKRHTSLVLETEDGTILRIHGTHKVLQTNSNGYSSTVCGEFLNGFPHCWQSCKPCYPKPECQPGSSNASNSGVDSDQFYLKQFELGRCFHTEGTYLFGKLHDILESFSHNNAMFQKSSHVLNGTPRFEEYTCDGDIATNENVAASSEAGTGSQRTPAVTLEIRGCREETQHMALTEKEVVDEEMPTSVYLGMQNSSSLSGTLILEEYTCDGDIPTNEDASASNVDNERYTTLSKEVNNVEIGLIAGIPSSERGHDDIAPDVSLAPTVECTNNAVSESVHSTPATDRKKTPVASLKSQGSCKENKHRASKKKPVGRPKKQISPHEKCQSATRSLGTRNPVSYVLWSPLTRGKATSLSMSTPEDLKLKRTRSGRVVVPKLDKGCQSIVYGRDGLIAAITGLDSPAVPKCSESKTDRRKKRKTG